MKHRLYWLLPTCGAIVAAAMVAQRPAKSEPRNDAAHGAAANLPIKSVVLFSSGVGYFQRKGEIDGNARIDLTFQVRDINDLIKSMVVQDDGGIVSAVSYDSLDPVDRTLKSFAVNLTGNPTFSNVLSQLRGEKVEVVLNQSTANQPGTVTGSVLGLEKQKVVSKEGTIEADVLNLWCAEGVRAIKLGDVQRLRFLNPTMETEFKRALDTLALSHDAQKKAVSLSFTGEGKRDVKVGYVVENPIWKTSYRLVMDKDGKPFLQGWAVVDNPTDDDWNQVGMALISGRPVSFQMDLYQPLYVPRPVVELELFQSLRPVAYDGRVGRLRDEAIAKRGFVDNDGATPMAKDEAESAGEDRALGAGKRRLAEKMDKLKEAQTYGANLANDMKKRMDMSQGVQSAATASQLGDFFQYVINAPVNLPRQKSALLPIVNKEVEGTRLSIYNPNVHAKFPMLGLKLKNTSGLHLMQGPITVFEGSVYAGDARINDVSPNDERLISYAVDLGTEVETKVQVPPQRLTNVKIQNGLVIRTDRHREEKTYTATNRTSQARTLWIEHPYRAEFTLISKEKPAERTSDVYRFEMKLPARQGESLSQTIIEERDIATQIGISNTDDTTIRFFINSTVSSEKVKAALRQASDLKARLAATSQELAHVVEQLRVITEDQGRLRANLREMPTTAAAYKRYIDKFDKQETEIESLRESQKKLQAQQLKDRQAIDTYLQNLNVE